MWPRRKSPAYPAWASRRRVGTQFTGRVAPRCRPTSSLGYVVNVIEQPAERAQVLQEAWQLSRQTLIVAARLDWDVRSTQTMAFGDEVITARGTFQKFFTHEELQEWIQSTLATEADAAGPGSFTYFETRVTVRLT